MGGGVVNTLEGRSGPSANYDQIKKLLNEKVRMLQENTYRPWDRGSWLSIGQSKLHWNFSLFCEIWRKTVYSNEIMVAGPLIWLPCTFMKLINWKLLKLFKMKWMTSVFDLGPLFDCPCRYVRFNNWKLSKLFEI